MLVGVPGYDRVGESPLLLRRRGISPRTYAQWFLGTSVAMLAVSPASVGVGDGFLILAGVGGILAVCGAFLLGMVHGTESWIVREPRQVELRPTSQGGKVVIVAGARIPGEDVRRIELHAVLVSDRPGGITRRFIVAIVARARVVELTFGASDDARAIALALREQLPHIGDVRERDRSLSSAYGIGVSLVLMAGIGCAMGCMVWGLSLAPKTALAALPPVVATAVVTFAVYYATRSLAPGAIRRMVEVEYELSR